MSQSLDTAPPWWDGTISINFSEREWEYIRNVLQQDLVHFGSILGKDARSMQTNIIDRIEKNLGIE